MGLGEAGAWLAVGGGKKLQFVLGIRAVAASQSMSSASGQRVWAKAGPGLIPWLCPMKGPTRVCVDPRAVTQGAARPRAVAGGLSYREVAQRRRRRLAGRRSGTHLWAKACVAQEVTGSPARQDGHCWKLPQIGLQGESHQEATLVQSLSDRNQPSRGYKSIQSKEIGAKRPRGFRRLRSGEQLEGASGSVENRPGQAPGPEMEVSELGQGCLGVWNLTWA